MEEKQQTKEPPDMIKKIERCIKRFEKLEKQIKQPWRKSDAAAQEQPRNLIKKLKDILRKVERGKMTDSNAIVLVQLANTMAMLSESELKQQNMQKSLGEEITPFGKKELGSG
jgi:hypothetical protein